MQKLILDLTGHYTEDDGMTDYYEGEVAVFDGSKLLKTWQEKSYASDRGNTAMGDAMYFIFDKFGIDDGAKVFDDAYDEIDSMLISGIKSEISWDGEKIHTKVLEKLNNTTEKER